MVIALHLWDRYELARLDAFTSLVDFGSIVHVNILFGYAQSHFQGIFRKDRIYLLMLQDCGEFILKYRNKTDIVAQMLASATDREVARTRMMSIAYVPHEQATQFLAMLVESGLLMYDQETRLYRTSQKRRQLLQMYNGICKCMGMDYRITPEVLE